MDVIFYLFFVISTYFIIFFPTISQTAVYLSRDKYIKYW